MIETGLKGKVVIVTGAALTTALVALVSPEGADDRDAVVAEHAADQDRVAGARPVAGGRRKVARPRDVGYLPRGRSARPRRRPRAAAPARPARTPGKGSRPP